jgi:cell division protein FtsN
MKNYFVLGAAVCVALSMVSCKSSESAYKKAYEKAKQQRQTQVDQPTTTTTTTTTQPTVVAPVQTVTTAPVATENTRSENLTLVNGTGLKAYSVVVGSFSIRANADNLQKTLKNNGYSAQIATNPQGMYRVIASTFDDLTSAVNSRNALRNQYPDAWLLRK